MSDYRYDTYQHYGTAAERAAFTPTPPGLAGSQPVYIWYETDTGNTYLYHTAWVLIAGSTSSIVQRATVTLTDADIKALPTTPFELVAAVAAKRISLISCDLYKDSSAGAYTNIDVAAFAVLKISTFDVSIYIPDSNGPSGATLTDFLGAADVIQGILTPRSVVDYVSGWGAVPVLNVAPGSLVNAALNLVIDNNGAGDLTGGNAANTLIADVLYYLID